MLLEWVLMHTVVCGAVALAGSFVALTADKDSKR